MKSLVIIILLLICVFLFIYCWMCEAKELEEKYHEIRKFEEQGNLVRNNYYVLTDNNNDDIVKNTRRNYMDRRRMERYSNTNILPKLTTDGITLKPYGYYSESPDINEYIHSFDYNTGHRVLDGFDIYDTKAMGKVNTSKLNVINVNDFYKPYNFRPVVNSSVYPVLNSQVELKNGMITSIYPDICSIYGSSNLPDDINMYFKSTWCNIGILSNNNATPPFTVLNLYAQFTGGGVPWRYRIYNKLTSSYVFLPETTRGSGTYGALRDGDILSNIPGFGNSNWIVQIQKDRTYVFERT